MLISLIRAVRRSSRPNILLKRLCGSIIANAFADFSTMPEGKMFALDLARGDEAVDEAIIRIDIALAASKGSLV